MSQERLLKAARTAGEVVIFNNQNTILLTIKVDNYIKGEPPYIVFVHDNRMFAFNLLATLHPPQKEEEKDSASNKGSEHIEEVLNDRKDFLRGRKHPNGSASRGKNGHHIHVVVDDGKESDPDEPNNRFTPPDIEAAARDLILLLITTPKYRLLSALYFMFRLMDELLLVAIVVLSIINGAFTKPTQQDMAMISAIGIELFYDVMVYTSKFWFLQRLSVYIGLILYMIYYSIVAAKVATHEIEGNTATLIWSVLTVRLVAYILEILVDIGLDLELHNDLHKLQYEPELPQRTKWYGKIAQYFDVRVATKAHFPYSITEPGSGAQKGESQQKIDKSQAAVAKTGPAVAALEDFGFYLGSCSAWSYKSVFHFDNFSVNRVSKWFRLMYVIPFLVVLVLAVALGLIMLIPMAIGLLIAWHLKQNRNLWREITNI